MWKRFIPTQAYSFMTSKDSADHEWLVYHEYKWKRIHWMNVINGPLSGQYHFLKLMLSMAFYLDCVFESHPVYNRSHFLSRRTDGNQYPLDLCHHCLKIWHHCSRHTHSFTIVKHNDCGYYVLVFLCPPWLYFLLFSSRSLCLLLSS